MSIIIIMLVIFLYLCKFLHSNKNMRQKFDKRSSSMFGVSDQSGETRNARGGKRKAYSREGFSHSRLKYIRWTRVPPPSCPCPMLSVTTRVN